MGVLVWEILTRAKRPYDYVESEFKIYLIKINKLNSDQDVLTHLSTGHRLRRPKYLQDDEIWNLLKDCWHKIPSERPTFIKIYYFFKMKYHAYIEHEGSLIMNHYYNNNFIIIIYYTIVVP